MSTAVLIVNYKTYDELAQCLSSLGSQLAEGDEVVVVDQESDAARLEAAAKALGRPLVSLTRRDNIGFAAGVNLAAASSRAPYLLLLNPDATAEGPIVRVLESFLTAHPDVGVAGARVLNADGTIQPSARMFPDLTTWFGGRTSWLTRRFPGNALSQRNLAASFEATSPLDVDWLSGSCFMTPRAIFERMGGLDAGFFMYWEDADYCSRVMAAGYRRMLVPEACVRHRAGRSAARAPARAIRTFHKSAFRLYCKRATAMGRLFAPLVGAGLWLRGEWRARRAAPGSDVA